MRHVVFVLGQQRYALPLSAVREVFLPGLLSRVPRAPSAVLGIMNQRGRVVTVVDLGALVGSPVPWQEGLPPGKVMLLDRGRRDLGLLVTEVEGIHTVEGMGPAPEGSAPAVRGVASVGAGEVTVLDATEIERQLASLFKPR